MGKKNKQKKGEDEVSRIPLPLIFKDDMRESSESDEVPPRMTQLLTNFKRLCAGSTATEDFIKIKPAYPAADGETGALTSGLEPGITEEDKYFKADIDGIVQKIQKDDNKEEDYSGAAKAVIKEKISKRAAKKLKKEEREKTVGKKWFDMPALELTEERKRDLELLQMRGVLDPKRFYKKSAQEEKIPKYFQVGTVVDSPFDFYSDRLTKKERKSTMVDELLADAEFKKYNKRKYVEIIESQQRKVRHGGYSGKKKKT